MIEGAKAAMRSIEGKIVIRAGRLSMEEKMRSRIAAVITREGMCVSIKKPWHVRTHTYTHLRTLCRRRMT